MDNVIKPNENSSDPIARGLGRIRKTMLSKAQNKCLHENNEQTDEKTDHITNSSSNLYSSNDQIEKWSRLGKFDAENINSSNEHPTFLTRTPIFSPSHRSSQKALINEDLAIEFNTPWGQGKKYGAPLSVYDEDTLIAIGKLRQYRLQGLHHQMPLPITHLPGTDQNASIYACCCLLSNIQNICGTTKGGKANKLRLASLKRLSSVVIELSAKSKSRYSNYGTSIKLVDIAWEEYEKNAVLYIQMSPMMSYWYDNEYTFIDWNIRKQLSDTGKSIHRFLSGQPKKYEIHTKKLLNTIGYVREYKKFMADLRSSLERLESIKWIKSWKIHGNGYGTPQKLIITR